MLDAACCAGTCHQPLEQVSLGYNQVGSFTRDLNEEPDDVYDIGVCTHRRCLRFRSERMFHMTVLIVPLIQLAYYGHTLYDLMV